MHASWTAAAYAEGMRGCSGQRLVAGDVRKDMAVHACAQVSTLERIYADGKQKYAAHQMFLPTNRTMKKANFAATASADEWRDTY